MNFPIRVMKEYFCVLQSGKAAEKTPAKPCDVEVYEKKIKLLEKQRKDVSLLFLLLVPFVPLGKTCGRFFSQVSLVSLPVTGTRGEQTVGHSVERHEVTVWTEGTVMTPLWWRVWEDAVYLADLQLQNESYNLFLHGKHLLTLS